MSTPIANSDELSHFTAVFSKRDLALDIAPRLSCTEVKALAGLLRALGEPTTADTWIQKHAIDDEIGDPLPRRHPRVSGPDRPDGRPPLRQLPVIATSPRPTAWAQFM